MKRGIVWLIGLWAMQWANAAEVVVYTSLDQVFSQPVLEDFERETGIAVRAVYDVEAAKTTGLVNRLIAETSRPQADVFWNSEVGRTLVLKAKGVLAPYPSPAAEGIPASFKDPEHNWTGFAARSRVFIYNTQQLSAQEVPQSILDLAAPRWKGKIALAYPLFGTAATHVAALYAALGAERAETFLRDLVANDVVIVDGNAAVRDAVARGEIPLGLTDTDDVNVALQRGQPVAMTFPDATGMGTLLIPNTVALIRGAPHPEEGKKLIDYLLSPAVERRLAFAESMQIPLRVGVERPARVPAPQDLRAMAVSYPAIADHLEVSARFCRELFRR